MMSLASEKSFSSQARSSGLRRAELSQRAGFGSNAELRIRN